jgi:hypothetical protein
MFQKLFLVLACCSLVLFQTDVLARGGGSSSFQSSSPARASAPAKAVSAPTSNRQSSSVFSAPAPMTAPKSAPITGGTNNAPTNNRQSTSTFSTPTLASTPAPAVATTTTKPVAVANTTLSNKMAKQDAVGAKKFTTRDDAATAFRQQQASKYTNNFTSEPTTRPSYIPADISRGGNNYHVVYHGGCYGYYTGSIWTPLNLATYMVVTDAMLGDDYGYGAQPVVYQQPYQQPIVQPVVLHHHHGGGSAFLIFLATILVVVIVVVIIVKFSK